MDGKELVKAAEIRMAELGLKKGEFYKITGISSASYSQWSTGKANPSDSAIRKINNVLGTNFELSNKTDNVYATIQMLQSLRDADRALLEVAKDMPENKVQKMVDFMRSLKED